MQTFKIVLKSKANKEQLKVASVDAANAGQARSYAKHVWPEMRITSMKPIGWRLDEHHEFIRVSHLTHVMSVKAARKRAMQRQR